MERNHAVSVTDGIHDAVVRGGQRHVIEAVIADEAPHGSVLELSGDSRRDPANVGHGQRRFERRQFVRFELARQVEQATGGQVAAECLARVACARDDFDLPAALLESRAQRLAWIASYIDELPPSDVH